MQRPPTGCSLDTPSRVNTRVITLKRPRRRTDCPATESQLLCFCASEGCPTHLELERDHLVKGSTPSSHSRWPKQVGRRTSRAAGS